MTDCTYQQRSSIPTSRLLGRARNQIIVRFLGNYLLKPASARARE